MAKGRAVAIILDESEEQELTALTRKHGAPQSLAGRGRIVLAAAVGLNNKEIASKVGMCAATVGTWRRRLAERRMDGLYDEPRPGVPCRTYQSNLIRAFEKAAGYSKYSEWER